MPSRAAGFNSFFKRGGRMRVGKSTWLRRESDREDQP
jgi:hypothetical protein